MVLLFSPDFVFLPERSFGNNSVRSEKTVANLELFKNI